jgi:hypothetical protein
VEREVAGVVPHERGDAVDDQLGGVVEVVDDDGAEASKEELQHGVATDVARPPVTSTVLPALVPGSVFSTAMAA